MTSDKRATPASNRIPIPFEQFVEGILKIDPKTLASHKKKRAAKRKAAKAKKAKG